MKNTPAFWTLAIDKEEFHIVSTYSLPPGSTSPIWRQWSNSAVPPMSCISPNNLTDDLCLWAKQLKQTGLAYAEAACLAKLFRWRYLWGIQLFTVYSTAIEELSQVSKRSSSGKPSLSTTLFVFQVNSPILGWTRMPAITAISFVIIFMYLFQKRVEFSSCVKSIFS